jgi:hypothetical protein
MQDVAVANDAQNAPLGLVDKPDCIRRLGPVDIGELTGRLLPSLPEKLWQVENAWKENAFGCFHHTRHIIFRFPTDLNDPRQYISHPAWRMWRELLLPVMARAVVPYGLAEPVFPKAMLARLEVGHKIDEHIDKLGASDRCCHKIHVPLQTDPQAVLSVNGRAFHLDAGNAYEVNNLTMHGAFNGGESDRIHFIFEVFDADQCAHES